MATDEGRDWGLTETLLHVSHGGLVAPASRLPPGFEVDIFAAAAAHAVRAAAAIGLDGGRVEIALTDYGAYLGVTFRKGVREARCLVLDAKDWGNAALFRTLARRAAGALGEVYD